MTTILAILIIAVVVGVIALVRGWHTSSRSLRRHGQALEVLGRMTEQRRTARGGAPAPKPPPPARDEPYRVYRFDDLASDRDYPAPAAFPPDATEPVPTKPDPYKAAPSGAGPTGSPRRKVPLPVLVGVVGAAVVGVLLAVLLPSNGSGHAITGAGTATTAPPATVSSSAAITAPPSSFPAPTAPPSTRPTSATPTSTTSTTRPGDKIGAPVLDAISPSTGVAGQTVVLSGANFFSSDGVISVSFGGATAPVSCPDQTTCEVTVPSHSGPPMTPVTVVTTSGRSNSLDFVYAGPSGGRHFGGGVTTTTGAPGGNGLVELIPLSVSS